MALRGVSVSPARVAGRCASRYAAVQPSWLAGRYGLGRNLSGARIAVRWIPWPFAGLERFSCGQSEDQPWRLSVWGCPRSRPGYTNSFMAGWPGIRYLTGQSPQGAMPKKAILAQSHTVILPKQATGFKSQYPKMVSKMAQLA